MPPFLLQTVLKYLAFIQALTTTQDIHNERIQQRSRKF